MQYIPKVNTSPQLSGLRIRKKKRIHRKATKTPFYSCYILRRYLDTEYTTNGTGLTTRSVKLKIAIVKQL